MSSLTWRVVDGRRHPFLNGVDVKRELSSWRGMHTRCYDRNGKAYRYYGQRGIVVCPEWRRGQKGGRNDNGAFARFCAYMGPRPPGTSVDRIRSEGNYEPGNVRWADNGVQALNKRLNPRKIPLKYAIASALRALERYGRVLGFEATEKLMRDVEADLVEAFGEPRAALSLSETGASVEEAFIACDYDLKSHHFDGIENSYLEFVCGQERSSPKKRGTPFNKRRPHKMHQCSHCGSIAHTITKCRLFKEGIIPSKHEAA